MRPHRLGLALCVALLAGGCGFASSLSPSPATCPELNPTVLLAGLARAERLTVDAGSGRIGTVITYRDSAGRELTFASGAPGEIGGQGIGQRVTIRGREAEILAQPAIDTLAITWLEAPADKPCHQYRIVAVGLTEAEFFQVLAGVR